MVVHSNYPGMGKSFFIKNQLIETKKLNPLCFFLSGDFNLDEGFKDFKKIDEHNKDEQAILIKLEVGDTDKLKLGVLDDFLFMIGVLRYYPFENSYLLFNNPSQKIFIEIQNTCKEEVLTNISSLQLFCQKEITEFDLTEFEPGEDPISSTQIALKLLKAHKHENFQEILFDTKKFKNSVISKKGSIE